MRDYSENCVKMYPIKGAAKRRELGADTVVMTVVDGKERTASVAVLYELGIDVMKPKVEVYSVVVELADKPDKAAVRNAWFNVEELRDADMRRLAGGRLRVWERPAEWTTQQLERVRFNPWDQVMVNRRERREVFEQGNQAF